MWTGVHPKPHTLKNMTSYQRVNHFPRSYELTRKDRLFKNIEKMQHAKGAKHFDFIPQTFVMPTDFRDLCSNHYRNKGPWIVKPVASSRGRGIYIVNSPDQVPLDETLVVAKYIDNPLLVDGHKCDLRLYVAVTSYDPLIVYMYEEGLVRFATVKYDTTGKHLWNPCMHLCNYSINKYHSDYIMNEDADTENVGHKWTLSALLRHLRSQGIDTAVLMSRIEEVVVKAILASAPPIVTACRMFVPHTHNCFELYGFDILIDSTLKPWLLEVNLSPSLGCDSPLDVRVKSAMLVDLLTLVGVPAVDPMLRRVGELRRLNTPSDVARKLNQCRRVQSADMLMNPVSKRYPPGGTSRLASSSLSLSAEETRMVKYARAEFERRGGFVRIFPSSESWKRYSQFLDPATGMVITASSNFVQFPLTTTHNFNYTLHQQLFPELRSDNNAVLRAPSSHPPGSSVRFPSPERVNRYERALLQGHKASLDGMPLDRSDAEGSCVVEEVRDVGDVLKEVLNRLEKGERLSQYQARRMFGQYLICILRRMTKNGTKPEESGNVEIILRFLQKASSNLRTPYFVQMPSRKLSGKDRLAMVAKQLNDFVYLYNRETDLYTDSVDHSDQLPSRLFLEFLALAREADLEEALTAHTRVNKCAHLFLGRCGVNFSQSFGLLRPFPPISLGREECSCRKSCSRTRESKATAGTVLPRTSLPSAVSPSKKITAKVSRML
ncbi:hypothetical protein R5R35_002743 [Gryllus longicercus]|uniref:Tubulin--tyrosine ligase-like protein 5 n=1 Tax=Gryllus longicercus TaxID=2509291 RepID=A0AAN9VFV7_9ORTH